jgi:hypothetical protein
MRMTAERDAAAGPADVLQAAAEVLSLHLGAPVGLESAGAPGGVDGKRVLRCRLTAAPKAAPETVIVKHVPRPPDEPRLDLLNEWAALRFLAELDHDRPLAPAFYGGDLRRGVLVLEDLGEGDALADVLLGSDAASARAALVLFARTLGRMQAASVSRLGQYRRLRAQLGPPGGQSVIEASALAGAFQRALVAAGLSPSGARDDVDAIVGRVTEPGPFLSFVHGDACPGNERLVDGRFVLLDFATGGLRHALLDGVCGRLAFPSSWCARRLPDDVAPLMEAAYRSELVRSCPAARDDAAFAIEAATATAYWLVETTTVALAVVPFRDVQWGVSTVGQRLALRVARFARLSEEIGAYRALAALLVRLLDVLGLADRQMPLYPAFGGPAIPGRSPAAAG